MLHGAGDCCGKGNQQAEAAFNLFSEYLIGGTAPILAIVNLVTGAPAVHRGMISIPLINLYNDSLPEKGEIP